MPDYRNKGWKEGLPTKNGGFIPHSAWTRNHQIRNDNLLTMSLKSYDLIKSDLKFSPVTNGFRCMDHLFQNLYDHIVKAIKKKQSFKSKFIENVFNVSECQI